MRPACWSTRARMQPQGVKQRSLADMELPAPREPVPWALLVVLHGPAAVAVRSCEDVEAPLVWVFLLAQVGCLEVVDAAVGQPVKQLWQAGDEWSLQSSLRLVVQALSTLCTAHGPFVHGPTRPQW